jgi:NitT/TauT family transport system substrate-binding protein
MMRRPDFIRAASASALLVAARGTARAETAPASVTIVYQPGLGYMPFIVMQKTGSLAKAFPTTQLSWKVLSNGAVIRDGFVSNTIQIGAVGSAPFLIGWDRGVPWKILCTAVSYDFWLVVTDPNIKSIKDLKPGDKIASPSPDSINALVLRAALTRAGLPPNYLDIGFVAMPHPLAEQALLDHQVVGHIATPPFAEDEVKRGAHAIMHTTDGFPGGMTSTLVVAGTNFAQQYPAFMEAFYKDYVATVKSIQTHPDDAAKIYVDYTGGKAKLAEIDGLMRELAGTIFGVVPRGVIETARFMAKLGQIKKTPSSFAEISLGFVGGQAG